MAPQTNVNSPAFELHLPNVVRVAGETIQGRVELNVARAQDDGIESLCINLRGSIVTTIIESNTDGSDTKHERTIELINSAKSLWERGTVFPNPGSHVLVLSFQFKLPDDLPPSFHLSVLHHEALISYTLEVVGSRPGLLRRDRLITKIIPVLPAASPAQWAAKTSLRKGWNDAWTTIFTEQKIRYGIWGDHSHARAEVKIPDLTSFPRATPIPLKLCIETRTKPMSRTAAPVDKNNKPIFPAPPTQSAEVKLFFQREANIFVERRNGTVKDSFQTHGGFGDPTSTSVKSTIEEPEWIPDPEREGRGVWKRSVRFETTVSLPFAPTFSTETVDCKYSLCFNVSFPGIGNDMKFYVPIHLDPAHVCPPTPSPDYADNIPPNWSPPLALLDLPPAYCTEPSINQD
ncbi:hypothetical protein B0H13DRAFT_1950194 [Mycena leptocephala]|nr:hypothetical protein B0H13DRAFT_1950194 [Mycena leptocephala]